ncbi:DUF2510 domain-containing protein [Curtobacterium sp. VKM Ac-2884]|uniref:DUF2510 domain-containing protein n=1 Tax=Curtobacterium sp. VKM Ac-2884 TaxID=2783818 RepID=UPI00188A0DA0|nr:DUF2510 domain-containing protein [Curtobacterium sp. VKM Ac-2884]MBF4603997.1 DUF2510 domain-containing protein [Curtobacterium sp. VKM Ac-2884]
MHDDDAPPAAPAGWYPSVVAGRERYWDGSEWIVERAIREDVETIGAEVSSMAEATVAAPREYPAQAEPAAVASPDPGATTAANNNVRRVGWHEHGWKRNTWRYWTGRTWLNEGDGGFEAIEQPRPVRKSRQILPVGWWFTIIAIPTLALIVTMVAVSVDSHNTEPRTASEPDDDTALVEAAPDLPAGFKDAGSGIALKWLSRGDDGFEGGCEYSFGSCFKAKVYAYDACPSGVYVGVNGLDSAGTVVASSNDTLYALGEGETGALEFTFTRSGVSRAKFTQATCR